MPPVNTPPSTILPHEFPKPPLTTIDIDVNRVPWTIPCRDHPGIIRGPFASLNCWCPRSRNSPLVARAMGLKELRLTKNDEIKAQMEALANDILKIFESGQVGLLALQEVPNPKNKTNNGFKHLTTALITSNNALGPALAKSLQDN
jgi:hypothetical protein